MRLEEKDFELGVVKVSSFCIDRTEVTIGDYVVCLDSGACQPIQPARHIGHGDAGLVTPVTCIGVDLSEARWRHPIVCVTFSDAEAFCKFRGGRLPADFEWFLARAGAAGNDPASGMPPNTTNSHLAVPLIDKDTSEVGTHPDDTSMYGVVDMLQNATEWVVPQHGFVRIASRFPSPSAGIVGAISSDAHREDSTAYIEEFRQLTRSDNATGFRCAYPADTIVKDVVRRRDTIDE